MSDADEHSETARTVLWWSRAGREYSRDRIIRNVVRSLGWKIVDFQPLFSQTADFEARLRSLPRTDLVWVPCFRQRDVAAARKWAARQQIPMILDPLISAWDKQVFERRKFAAESRSARRLLNWESDLFRGCQALVADTWAHAELFRNMHRLDKQNIHVIPVSAEESLFHLKPATAVRSRPQILFYGSFIGLQGPTHIATAAKNTPEYDWRFIGRGPLTNECQQIAGACSHVRFQDNIPYDQLPNAIEKSNVVMGIFGDSAKAGRVIPNKVYQAMACGRPVVTRNSTAYPDELRNTDPLSSGLIWAAPASADSIAACLHQLLTQKKNDLPEIGQAANRQYNNHFSENAVRCGLQRLLDSVVENPDILDRVA